MVFSQLSLAFICLLFASQVAQSQDLALSVTEKEQAIKNLEAIITGSKSGFPSLQTSIRSAQKGIDSGFKARHCIFPASTKAVSRICYYKKFIYYFEETEADIYTITQALRPLLTSGSMTEVYPTQQGTYTFTARAFASEDLVLEISYKSEKERKYSSILVARKNDYSDKALTPLVNNWEAEKKGFGFIYMANGKDSVMVTEVLANSPAAAAGLKKNDLITTIHGTDINGKTRTEVAELISKAGDKARLDFMRNGKTQTTTLLKDWRYKYDKTCLSGDCVNGKGMAMSNVSKGLLMEGKFSEGQLVDGDWYLNAKNAQEKGSLFRRGTVIFDRFFTGFAYDVSKPEGGFWYYVNSHDIVKTSSINEKTVNGYVRYFSSKARLYLWEGEFRNGKKSGEFYEYLHDKGFFWSYYLDGGEKHFHKLKKLVDGQPTGEWLNDDALKYNEAAKTWSGMFNTGLVNPKLDNAWPLEDISKFDDIETKAWAARNITSHNKNEGDHNTANTKPGVRPTAPAVKICSHCNGNAVTYTYVCSTCNNTGWSNTYIGPNSYSLVRQICGCVGGGMMGYQYIQNTLKSRRKVCGYCNGKGVEK